MVNANRKKHEESYSCERTFVVEDNVGEAADAGALVESAENVSAE